MPSSALGVTWAVFTLTAIPVSWLVLVPFSVATGHWWGQIVYGLTVTIMESVFAIGLILNMLSLHTSHSFCLAQAIVPSLGSYILSGICICLAISTYSTVFNLKHGPLRHRRNPLEWKNIYIIFIGLWPLLATTTYVTTSFKQGVTFQSLNYFPCEVVHPLWPRLLGFAGAPFLASVPSLVLSIITAYRITAVSRMRKWPTRRPEQAARLSPIRITAEERIGSALFADRLEREWRAQNLTVPTSQSGSHEKHMDRGSMLSIPHSISDSAWLPSPPTVHDVAVSDASHVLPESCSILNQFLSDPRASSPSLFPPARDGASTPPSPITFAPVNQTPAASRRPSFDPNSLYYYDELDPMAVSPFNYDENSMTPIIEQELVVHRAYRRSQPPQTDRIGSKTPEASAYGTWPPMLTGSARASGSLTPPSELTGALRRIIFFQIAFSCIVILAGLTTWIDLAKHRDVPSSFGTQHVALVLIGWGPFFVFGHHPAVGGCISKRLRQRTR